MQKGESSLEERQMEERQSPLVPIAEAIGVHKRPPTRRISLRPEDWDYYTPSSPNYVPVGLEGKPWECNTCHDMRWLKVDYKLEPCPNCTVTPELERVILNMGIPQLYWHESFQNTNWKWSPFTFPPYKNDVHGNPVTLMSACYDHAIKMARREAKETWLVMTGDPGCGKTRIACCILRERWEKHHQAGRFLNMVSYLQSLRASLDENDDRNYASMLKVNQQAPLLVIDDLGVEKSTEWSRERLYDLVNYRINDKLETIITTNVSLATLEPRVWDRLMSYRTGVTKEFDLSKIPSYRSGNTY